MKVLFLTHRMCYYIIIILKSVGEIMIRFVLGRSGTGKTAYLYDKLSQQAREGDNRLIMLVPDQSTFETEKDFLEILGPKLSKNVSVFGFARFCQYVLEQTKTESKNVIDDSTRSVIMSLALEQLNDSLEIFAGGYEKKSVIDTMLSALKECKKSKISTALLRNTASLVKDHTLKSKLLETALIIDAFDAIVEQSYIDPLENLTRVADILLKNNLFSGFTLAIDSFSGFSVQQLEVIRLLFEQCESVYVSLTLDPFADDKDSLFAVTNDTYKRLKSIARSADVDIKAPVKLSENYRAKTDELKILEKNIYRTKHEISEKENKSINLYSAGDIYSECEYVAAKIKELVVENGYLYSDIAVVCRDIKPYSGILNTILEKYEIPFFMDMSTDIYIKPIIRYVCSVFDIVLKGFAKDDVLSLLKTGLTQNSVEEISDFENYVYVWNINGSSFKNEFKNNPKGFADKLSKSDEQALQNAEKVRKSLVAPLEKFRENIKDKTCKEITVLLYELLEENKVTKAISDMYDALEENGDLAQAKEQIRLWNLLMEAFDKTVAVAGDMKISPKRYFELLSLRLSALEIAEIPRTVDSVTVGTALRVRLTDCKVVFLIGCIDGIFPAVPHTSGVFSSFELKILALNNLSFGDDISELADLEIFMAYKSLTAPSEKLFVSYYKSDLLGNAYKPSSIISEITKIFPDTVVLDDADVKTPENSTWALLPAFEELALGIKNLSSENQALKKYFSENEKYIDKYNALIRACESSPFEFADTKNCAELFGDNLNISASQIEKFSLCRFSYFCNYGLNVRELRKAEINPIEYGTFVHYIMEKFFTDNSKEEFYNMSESEITAECDRILEEYVNSHFGGEENNTPSFMYRFTKIRESVHFLVLHIVSELKNSGFTPVDCELGIGSDIPSYTLTLETGQKISIRGSVDRVDMLKFNGVNYIRIVDYKTGSKQFKLSDILYGLNLQMLIYMYAIKLSGEKRYGEITPAGILYMPSTTPFVTADNSMTEEKIKTEIGKELKMNGMLLNSPDVLDNCDTAYISYKIKDGTLSSGGSLASLEEMGMIFKKLDMTVAEMGRKLYSGDVNATPLKGGHDACEYCPYDSVCAFHRNGCVNTYKVKNDKVCEILADEQRKGEDE